MTTGLYKKYCIVNYSVKNMQLIARIRVKSLKQEPIVAQQYVLVKKRQMLSQVLKKTYSIKISTYNAYRMKLKRTFPEPQRYPQLLVKNEEPHDKFDRMKL